MLKKINCKSGLSMLSIIFLISLLCLNILWIVVYKFDRTPLYAIDGLSIGNIMIALIVKKYVKLSSEILLIMNLTLIFLGFMLIRGLLILR